MRFEENFIIQLPVALKTNPNLNWTDRMAFFFFNRYEGDSIKVQTELNLSRSRMKAIKSRLAAHGFIEKIIDENGQIRYIPINTESRTWDRIRKLREISKVGLNKIGDQNILAWQRNHSLQFILQQMEVIEWTYRKSKLKTISKPHALVATILKQNGTVPPDDFVSGFWEVSKPKETRKPVSIQEYREVKTESDQAIRELRKIQEMVNS